MLKMIVCPMFGLVNNRSIFPVNNTFQRISTHFEQPKIHKTQFYLLKSNDFIIYNVDIFKLDAV